MTLKEMLNSDRRFYKQLPIVIVDDYTNEVLAKKYNFFDTDYDEASDSLKDLEVAKRGSADYAVINRKMIIAVCTC